HASIVDGCRLSRAEVRIFPNRDLRSLEAMLKTDDSGKRRLIVSESLFSIDGVVADLPGLVALARTHDALLVVGDAHAYGGSGEKGKGLPELEGLAGGEIDVLVGTFSKALGSLGGYACTPQPIRAHLVNSARSLIFTTAASHA